MLKQRIIAVMVGIALLVSVSGASGIVADSLGFSVTTAVYASDCGGSNGGNCLHD